MQNFKIIFNQKAGICMLLIIVFLVLISCGNQLDIVGIPTSNIADTTTEYISKELAKIKLSRMDAVMVDMSTSFYNGERIEKPDHKIFSYYQRNYEQINGIKRLSFTIVKSNSDAVVLQYEDSSLIPVPPKEVVDFENGVTELSKTNRLNINRIKIINERIKEGNRQRFKEFMDKVDELIVIAHRSDIALALQHTQDFLKECNDDKIEKHAIIATDFINNVGSLKQYDFTNAQVIIVGANIDIAQKSILCNKIQKGESLTGAVRMTFSSQINN